MWENWNGDTNLPQHYRAGWEAAILAHPSQNLPLHFIAFLILDDLVHKIPWPTENPVPFNSRFLIFSLKKILYIFGEEGRKRRETSVMWLPLVHPLLQTCNPEETCVEQELTRQPCGCQASAQSTEPHQPGLILLGKRDHPNIFNGDLPLKGPVTTVKLRYTYCTGKWNNYQ